MPRAEFAAPRISFFPSIRATLNHILAVDGYYIDALSCGGLGPRAFHDFAPHATMASLAVAQSVMDVRLTVFCDGLTNAHLDTEITTNPGSAGVIDERCDDLLVHLLQHQIHHRGQVHAMLAGTPVKPPQLDEFFLAFDRTARAGDLELLGLQDPQDVA